MQRRRLLIACDGIGCCQTAIPKGLTNYRVWFDENFSVAEVYKNNKTGCCSYAALVDGANFTFSSSYLSSSTAFVNAYGYDGQMPLVVDWAPSLFLMLISWELWKERNARVFRNVSSPSTILVEKIMNEATLWALAGAKGLGVILHRE